jgi:hypothetical protein
MSDLRYILSLTFIHSSNEMILTYEGVSYGWLLYFSIINVLSGASIIALNGKLCLNCKYDCKGMRENFFRAYNAFNNGESMGRPSDAYDQKQLYHDCLSVILRGDLIQAQKHPPTVTVERNRQKIQLIARLPVMIMMGDQKSQHTLVEGNTQIQAALVVYIGHVCALT